MDPHNVNVLESDRKWWTETISQPVLYLVEIGRRERGNGGQAVTKDHLACFAVCKFPNNQPSVQGT